MAICFSLLRHFACSALALALALASAGNNKPARIAMMAMTTSSSIKVNPNLFGVWYLTKDAPLVAAVFKVPPKSLFQNRVDRGCSVFGLFDFMAALSVYSS